MTTAAELAVEAAREAQPAWAPAPPGPDPPPRVTRALASRSGAMALKGR